MSVEEYVASQSNMKSKAGACIDAVNDERRNVRYALLEEDVNDKKKMIMAMAEEKKDLESSSVT